MPNYTNLFHRLANKNWGAIASALCGQSDVVNADDNRLESYRIPDALHPAKPWSAFSRVKSLQSWGMQLAGMVKDISDLDAWRLVGHAVLIEHSDVERCVSLAWRIAEDAGMSFLFVRADAIADFPFDELMTREDLGPVLIFLELGELGHSPSENEAETRAFQYRLSQTIRTFNPLRPVVFLTSTIELEAFSRILRQVGLFDRVFCLPSADPVELGSRFLELIGQEKCADTLLAMPEKIGRLVKAEFSDPDQRDLAVLALQRVAAEELRKLEFMDLIRVHLNDVTNFEDGASFTPEARRQIAYHEAGHALITVLMTNGQNLPEYTGIQRGRSFFGMTIESYTYHVNATGRIDYSDFIAKIRICLAGRAAEELVFGPAQITRGSESDLTHATNLARIAFSEWGFNPEMTTSKAKSRLNLIVLGNDPGPEGVAYIDGQVREFLSKEYQDTLTMLSEQREALEVIVAELLSDGFIDQQALASLCDRCVDLRQDIA